MKIQMQTSTLSFLLLLTFSQAFAPSSRTFRTQRPDVTRSAFVTPSSSSVLRATADSALPDPTQSNSSEADEVQRLRAMAQKLRDEAASLAAEQTKKVSDAAMKAFAKFDLNHDGAISVDELKIGLEKATKHEIPQNRIEKLVQKLDANGDGALQMEEFASVDRLKNQLDFIVREEKAVALEEAKRVKQMEEEKQVQEMRMALVNDAEPTASDKVVSVLPYLFPLLDSLQYAGPWVTSHPDNALAQAAALVFTLYRSISLSGFLAFFALSFLSSDLSLNRLVRFNIQQAIYLDFALFVPGLMAALLGAVGSGLGLPGTGVVTEYLSDGVVLGTLATIAYASATSLLGSTPDQVPFVSGAAKSRMVTPDMFDEEGKLVGLSRGVEDDDVNKEE
mmetsp:Transcript_4955/g.11832  ORF Transcript_4955/g.11832 Transcript_4955/m.11832 type:complete len:392 (-) Transcript_4955:90-1265(-)